MSNLRKAAQQALDTWDAEDWFDADNLRAALAQPEPEPVAQLKRIHPLDIPLDVFVEDLSTRPRNIINAEMRYFTHSGDEYTKPPFTARHLLMFSRTEMAKWPNLGKRSLNEIEEMLRNRGLQLWHNHDERSLRLLREHPTYYTAPPQRKPLTEEEIREEAYRRCNAGWSLMCKKMVAAEHVAFVAIINDNTDGDGICCADDLLVAIWAHAIGGDE